MVVDYTTLIRELKAPAMAVAMRNSVADMRNPASRFVIQDGVKPVDLYCYLYARFSTRRV